MKPILRILSYVLIAILAFWLGLFVGYETNEEEVRKLRLELYEEQNKPVLEKILN